MEPIRLHSCINCFVIDIVTLITALILLNSFTSFEVQEMRYNNKIAR